MAYTSAVHPLLGYGIGFVVGALACWFFYGYAERYQKIALAVGVGLAVLGGVAVAVWLGATPVNDVKRALALIGVGLSVKLGGYNLGIAAQAGSGGFSSARTESMIGIALAAVILAISMPALKAG